MMPFISLTNVRALRSHVLVLVVVARYDLYMTSSNVVYYLDKTDQDRQGKEIYLLFDCTVSVFILSQFIRHWQE